MGITTTMKIIFTIQIATLLLCRMSNAVHLAPNAGASNIEEQMKHVKWNSPIGKMQAIGKIKHNRYAYVDRNDRERIHRPDTKLGKYPKSQTGQPHYLPTKLFHPEDARSFLPRYQHGRIWKKRNRRELGRSEGLSWAEWGSCNATCGVGYERREGRCNSGRCLEGSSMEWRGCVGIKCPNKKSHLTTIVLCAFALFAGFHGGAFFTILIYERKWILEKMKNSKTRHSGGTKLKSHQKKDAYSLRSPPPIPRKEREPSYVDVRELNTIKEECEDDVMDDDWSDGGNDISRKDEAGYLIPDGGILDVYHDYVQPTSEPEYIDIVE